MATGKNIAIGCIAAVVLVGVIVACVVGGVFILGLNQYADKAELFVVCVWQEGPQTQSAVRQHHCF